jgi:hypothetical protein
MEMDGNFKDWRQFTPAHFDRSVTMTLLQKVAKDPECHSCESRNPFFSDG